MGWRWHKSINLVGGIRANLSKMGVGFSWGIPGFRISQSPNGTNWLSIGIPGTGLFFSKKLGTSENRGYSNIIEHGTLPEKTVTERRPKFPIKWRNIK